MFALSRSLSSIVVVGVMDNKDGVEIAVGSTIPVIADAAVVVDMEACPTAHKLLSMTRNTTTSALHNIWL
jgi:hypothetical protein